MPELAPQSSAPPVPPHDPPPVVPPNVDPRRWEDFGVFRETFLLFFSRPQHNACLRVLGNLFYEMVLEFWHHWPDHPEGWLRGQLRAAVADLRHLEGFLDTFKDSGEDRPQDRELCRTAVLIAGEVGTVADRLERALDEEVS